MTASGKLLTLAVILGFLSLCAVVSGDRGVAGMASIAGWVAVAGSIAARRDQS